MLKERQIRDRLASYLEGAIPLSDFSAWLMGESWEMEADSPRGAQELAYQVLGRLSEQSTAGFPEEDLKRDLRRFAEHVVTTVDLAAMSRPRIHSKASDARYVRPRPFRLAV